MIFQDLTIQYGENEARHLMALKEVNAKEAPEAEMTQEEVIGFQDPMTPLYSPQGEKMPQMTLSTT